MAAGPLAVHFYVLPMLRRLQAAGPEQAMRLSRVVRWAERSRPLLLACVLIAAALAFVPAPEDEDSEPTSEDPPLALMMIKGSRGYVDLRDALAARADCEARTFVARRDHDASLREVVYRLDVPPGSTFTCDLGM